ncbi:TetR/AcrR family transcriptional regulator [Streptomyces sp. NPDC100445]|uniref:TetR/AcrR family transcriptional regulator n=1 Tax=Streptomyces sp. NPDC100445 TaxID=3366102 RepID=UPI0038087263
MLFWQHGYEGVSVSELTAAMGISPPSRYAAFGNKRELFAEVADRYGDTFGAFMGRAPAEEADACEAFARMLREAAAHYTDPRHPAGCLITSAAMNYSPQDEEVAADLRRARVSNVEAFEARLAAARAGRQLSATADPHALAVYFAAVVQGMSRQARDGATPAALSAVADLAMTAWPK